MADQLIWTDPVMARDDDDHQMVTSILSAAAPDASKTLFVLAAGFDPRCLTGLRRYMSIVGRAPNIVSVSPQPPQSARPGLAADRREQHMQELRELASGRLTEVEYPVVQDEPSAGLRLANRLTSDEMVRDIRTVLFDISSFPTSLSFPCLRGLLDVCDGKSGDPRELLVLVTENSDLDHAITKGNLGQPHVLAGFGAGTRTMKSPAPVRVWAPILGRGTGAAMSAIATTIDPQEVCPVLPFPAKDARLADRLMIEHWELFVEERRVQPTNLIYAAEKNPFDVYRTLVKFDKDYQHTLEPVGGAIVSVSTHGSKLLSIGALLAAYERNLPIYSVRANSYSLSGDHYESAARSGDSVACIWLRGDPYFS